jgi:hypothetical protein
MTFLCSLWSSGRLRGTHRAHTFEYPNWWMILSTLLLPAPSIASSSLVVILGRFEYDWQLVALLQASQLLMGGPSAGDQTHCPALVLTMPIAVPNGWRCFYPLPCLHRRLLSAGECLWLIRFVPKETQLLLSVYNARHSLTQCWKFSTSLVSSWKCCNYVHKRVTLKSCSTKNIIFIQQNWAAKLNVLLYFLGAPRICSLFTLAF